MIKFISSMLSFKIPICILIVATIVSISMVGELNPKNLMCTSSKDIATISEDIMAIKAHITSHAEQLEIWAKHSEFVTLLKHTLDEEIAKVVNREIRKYVSEGSSLPISESTVTIPEDEKRLELKETQSSFEKLQNRIVEVEEELRNEQTFRRHLEQQLEKTQSSLEKVEKRSMELEEELDAVTRNNLRFISSIEDMNRTIYEDHHRKLYNKVDGVVYKDETRMLDDRIVRVETEIRGGCNSNNFLKLAESMKNVEENLQIINLSTGEEDIVPRMTKLVSDIVRTDGAEMLEDKLNYVLYKTGQFKRELSDVRTDIRDLRTPDTHVDNCEVPVSNDPHLLIDNVTESDGTQKLIFGCRPIGQYVVNNPQSDVTCKRGSWEGRYPTCRSLLEPNAIEALSKVLMKEYPCPTDSEIYLDPRDRSRYISCSNGKASLNSCPENRHFNLEFGTCEMPLYDNLKEDRSELIQELEDLIPPISFEPNQLDDHTGILGTGPAGQLIVTPWSNFTLHCWYPETVWGNPVWNITYSKPETVTRILKSQTGKNKVSLTVIRAKEEDTGLYSCTTPFGKSHGIYVSVKVVRCPLTTFGGYLANAYLPNRYMGAVAEFPCTQGKEFTMCMATGKWSKDRPECTLMKPCKFPDTSNNTDLVITDHMEKMEILFFSCANGFRLIGNENMECLTNGTWSRPSLPKCVKE